MSLDNISRGFVLGTLAEAWRIGSRFVLTPIVLAYLGLAGYGVWTLLFSLAAYISIANVGFGVSYVKFTAECVRARDYGALRSILGAGIVVVGAFAAVGLAAAAFFGPAVLRWLNVPADLLADAHVAMLVVMGVVVLRLTIGCSHEVLSGLQRIDLSHRLTILASFVELVVTVPALVLGHGLVGMAIGHAIGQLVSFGVGLAWVRREDPNIRISPLHATRVGLRAVLRIGGPMQALAFAQIAIGEGVKVLLSVLVDPRATALYGLADKLVQLARTPTTAAVGPLLAVFADLRAARATDGEREVLRRAAKAVAIIGGGVAIFVAVTAHPALLAWTGQDVPLAAWATQLLVLASLVPQQSAVLTANMRAQGIVRAEVGFAIVSTVVGVALLVALLRVDPFFAVVASRAGSTAIGGLWFLRASLRQVGHSLADWWRAAALTRVAVVIAGVGAILFIARALLQLPELPVSARWQAAIDVLVSALAYASILGVAVWRFVLDDDERGLLVRALRRDSSEAR